MISRYTNIRRVLNAPEHREFISGPDYISELPFMGLLATVRIRELLFIRSYGTGFQPA
jgi:hypothetical protein